MDELSDDSLTYLDILKVARKPSRHYHIAC